MSKMRRKLSFGAGAATAILLVSSWTAPAVLADTTPPDTTDEYGTSEQSMVDVWTEYEVPAETQASLLDKLDQGTPLDSMTGADPASTETHSEGSKQVTVSRFADGSISITSLAPSDTSMTMSVSGCAVDATTYAQDCRVHGWLGPVELAFRTSYTKRDRQASVYNWGQKEWGCGPGTCSVPEFELIRQYQSGDLPAQLNLVTNYNFGGANTSVTLKLFVKDRSAWTP
ncbi:hypothetical protein [Microbacterium sp. LWO13-1.2]|uniref:hypothetical protein n=1 Tax=Microbacterium sp. LWO13-1.2 TaxID=3135262 RepID=UPI00313952FA